MQETLWDLFLRASKLAGFCALLTIFTCIGLSNARANENYVDILFPIPEVPKSPGQSVYTVFKPSEHVYAMYLQEQSVGESWLTVAPPEQASYSTSLEYGEIKRYRIMYLEETDLGQSVEHYSSEEVVGGLSFQSPESCASCHPRQYEEWQTSTMAYSAISPTFNTLEHIGNMIQDEEGRDGRFALNNGHNESTALFCQNCHSPVAVQQNEFVTFEENKDTYGVPVAASEYLSEIASHGVSCDVCHQIETHAENVTGGIDDGAFDFLGGIANSSFSFLDLSLDENYQEIKLGPLSGEELTATPVHSAVKSDYLTSSEFCASCHDVRIDAEDSITGESFRRLENLFTEWTQSPWADASHSDNPVQEEVTCQGCHMSLFPDAPPNTYDTNLVASSSTEERRVSNHYFTGVDLPLIDFPGIDITRDRRDKLLSQAVTLDVELDEFRQTDVLLPIEVILENVGTGHNIPSGFSQERQFWIKLEVVDSNDQIVYESGYLRDSDGDGLINDEDLNNFQNMSLDSNLEVVGIEDKGYDLHDYYGEDFNYRLMEGEDKKNLGLINFGNEFIRTTHQDHEEVFSPFLADAMDNTHSLEPFKKEAFLYDVPIDRENLGFDIEYPISVKASLHFRPFPPRFLKGLVQANAEHQLNLQGMDDSLLDKNEIVDMAEKTMMVEGEFGKTIPLIGSMSPLFLFGLLVLVFLKLYFIVVSRKTLGKL